MRNILIVGRPQSGKTTWAKHIVLTLGLPVVVNDVNPSKTQPGQQEWGQRPREVGEFMDIADQRRGIPTVFVWEEATAYLDNVGGKRSDTRRVVNALVRRFHTKHVNVLLFHSLQSVPAWVSNYVDRLILLPTADRPALVAAKFKGWFGVPEALERVNRSRERHPFEDINIFGA